MKESNYNSDELIARAVELEKKLDTIAEGPSYSAFLESNNLTIESQRLREWAKYGCLIGNPDSAWHP